MIRLIIKQQCVLMTMMTKVRQISLKLKISNMGM
jgi:hypothetical protein